DNAVSVIGKNNIEIYIDGRPMRDEAELRNLLSSDLRKVELLMAPGAAYESTTGAVLKITTKRDFSQGVSLTDQLMLRQRRRFSVTDFFDLSYRTGGWEFFAFGGINRDNSLTKGFTTNTLLYDGVKTVVGSSQHNSNPITVGVVKAGMNYARGDMSLGAYYRYHPERGDFKNSGTEWLDSSPEKDRDIDKRIRAHGHLASVYYENRFAGKYLLHFDGQFRRSEADNNVSTTYPGSEYQAVNSRDRRESDLCAAKLYSDFPLLGGDFTLGTQDSYTNTTLDYHMLNAQVGEYIPSSFTEASQISAAAFASWSRMFGRFSLSAGARYEYVDYDFKVDGHRDPDVSRRYHLLTPDVALGYSFNNGAGLNLSYKMATVKPPYSQLTGALNYVGIHEIEGGNPSLRDERMHDVQLMAMWRGFMLQGDFMRSIDTYAFVKQLYAPDNLRLIMRPINIDVSAMSLYLVWSTPVGRWTPNITVGAYRQWLEIAGTHYNKPIVSYYFDNVFSLPHGWNITANIHGNTQGDVHTDRFDATWFSMDASIGKTLLNKSLTMKLTATDIFNSTNNNWTMNTYGVVVDKRQSYDLRGISLDVIYSFRPYKSRYKGSDATEAEVSRL
ncbi:MAG: outer membrane beta-barrel family protein, partial [Paramuribaculum sp.]|nr:outer membrane beta-barrel family protein [Paramuribaculum sp.]